jgi:hypothetical protein
MSDIDDWAWKVIRSCGLSTANTDINVFALHEDIKEMLKPRELTDEEIDYITKKYFNIHPEAKLSEQFKIKLYELEDFARALLKKASEK